MDLITGRDFGIKPTIMVVGDLEFPQLLHESFVALAYGQIEESRESGLIAVRPGLGLAFEDAQGAQTCFEHFNAWITGSKSESAIGLSFIEFEDNSYGLCIYQDALSLQDRCIPTSHKSFVDPLLVCIGYIKRFPQQSIAYHSFKMVATKEPVYIEPLTQEGDFHHLGFVKSDIKFYAEADVPEDTIEDSLLRGKESTDGVSERSNKRRLPSYEQIHYHRQRVMEQFFPVTLERFSLTKELQSLTSTLLTAGYRRWQIQQAVCFIALQQRCPELFSLVDEDKAKSGGESLILDYLISNPEAALTTHLPVSVLTLINVTERIDANSKTLLQYCLANETGFDVTTPQQMMENFGLLDQDNATSGHSNIS